ncbi:MAG: tetratricopeptide repeat protein [Candidatus Sulfotelmatobacter sp.]|jgi:tetratricopeptide (TPR) repeat protein
MKRISFQLVLLILFFAVAAAADAPLQLLADGRVDQAVQNLEQQIHTTPTAEAYNLLCRAQFELDAWDAGIPACEKAVSLAPDNGLYHLWLGRIYGEKADRANFLKAAGLAKKVRTEFERAVEFSPNNCEAHIDLAEFYLEAPGIVGGGEDKARAQADLLITLDPGMAHWVRARIAQKNKDMVTAEQEYRAAIEATRGGARSWLNLAGFYRRSGRLDDMEQALRTMETRPLDHPAALMDGASMLFRTGRSYPMAIGLVRRYLTSATDEEWPAFKAHSLLGELLEKQGDRQAAAEEYRTALSMAHTFMRAQDGLERVAR